LIVSCRRGPPHPVLGTVSAHVSLINGGLELSSYPDRCVLQMERWTISGEASDTTLKEVEQILKSLKSEDDEFIASTRFILGRPPGDPLGDQVSTVIDDNAPPSEHTLPSRARALRTLAIGFVLWVLPFAVLVGWRGWNNL